MTVLCHSLVIQDIPQAVYGWAKIMFPSAILFIAIVLQCHIITIGVVWDCWNRTFWSFHLLSIGI